MSAGAFQTGTFPQVGEREFASFQALIHREAGIWLAPVKRALLAGRLARRIRDLGLPSFAAYYDRVAADPAERTQMLDRITTNETHFFREPRHFTYLTEEVFPRWSTEADRGVRPRKARIWSAACSTGEEPYSLAMSLLDAFPAGSGWAFEIVATDLSTRVLERAREAVWRIEKAREIPERALKAYMLRGTGSQDGRMKAGPELRELIRFSRLNLTEPFPELGRFDLVFLRNVLIYFDAATKEGVVGRVLERLAPDGLLFLGHAESLSGMALPVRSVSPTIYARRGAPAPAGPAEARR
ncbi:MAG TPA: protein-glutamate O-methyltransferase CheR [Anaeromyxobacteraceae bacterium]|nr:protein-glutamate O-methyltransferase CheR [Anaeromyxobacteraceae bacterium]